uniref:Uncharacterized protein n=1 Tax=Schlesneria paludicola TaxID=360056 RepID=A0A7C2K0G4_9PLAN
MFARSGQGGRQYLVYATKFEADVDLALVLPLPVPPKTLQEDVRFFNLEKYPRFFEDMDGDFPLPVPSGQTGPSKAASLTFAEVGSYEASFVPTVADLKHLDPRFRLSDELLEKLPQYADFGFAVFKLKAGRNDVHPLALDFPRREPQRLFFPTLQVRDGAVPGNAEFDHSLYAQLPAGKHPVRPGWLESQKSAGAFMKVELTQGIVDPEVHVYRRYMIGQWKNVDTFL